MDFAQQQRNPARHLVGFGAVVVLHVLLVWALMNGLARKVVEVVKAPLQVKVIEEIIKKPEQPPPPPPPPKLMAPPPPFIPPPEVQVAVPPPPAAITVKTDVAPPEPTLPREPVQAAAPPAPPAPPPAAPAVMSLGVVCPNWPEVASSVDYPKQARLDGIEGDVVVELLIGAGGEVKEVRIKKTPSRDFVKPVVRAIQQGVKCNPPGKDTAATGVIGFKLN